MLHCRYGVRFLGFNEAQKDKPLGLDAGMPESFVPLRCRRPRRSRPMKVRVVPTA
jgi:hypothetical protein